MTSDSTYKFAAVATDVVIFTVENGQLKTLLIKMKKRPFTNKWAMPGGLVKPKESLDAAAKRHLRIITGIRNIYLEQLYAFGKVNRDPMGRVVSVAYFALVPSDGMLLKTTKEYAGINWFPASDLPVMAYDHKEVVGKAVRRLQAKLQYTNIVYSLLPKKFTLTEMQSAYEVILNKEIDKRNFRKKINTLKLVRKVGEKKHGGAHRPAELYEFLDRKPDFVPIM